MVLIGSERIVIGSEVVLIGSERIVIGSEVVLIRSEVVEIRWRGGSNRFGTYSNRFRRKLSENIPLKKKKLLDHMHWIGNEVETSEALEVAGICTNKGRLSFEAAMLL